MTAVTGFSTARLKPAIVAANWSELTLYASPQARAREHSDALLAAAIMEERQAALEQFGGIADELRPAESSSATGLAWQPRERQRRPARRACGCAATFTEDFRL